MDFYSEFILCFWNEVVPCSLHSSTHLCQLCHVLALNPRLIWTPITLLRVFVLYPAFLCQFGGCEAFKDCHVSIPGWNIHSEHVPVKTHRAFSCRVHPKTQHFRLPQVLPPWRKPSWRVGKSHREEMGGVLPLPSPGWGGAACGSGSAGNCQLQRLIFVFKVAFLNFISMLAMQ